MRIGVDVGTSVTKAALFGPDGALVDVAAEPTALLRPAPGRYEHDVDGVVSSVRSLLARLVERHGPDVDLVALTGQGDGLWLLDGQARPVRTALSWMDGRGTAACSAWAADGTTARVFARTANAPFPGAGAALLAALAGAEPATLDAAATATQCQHAVFERLTGVRTATRSCATLPLLDPATGDYDETAVALTGLAGHRRLLPPVAAAPVVAAEAGGAPGAEGAGLPPATRVATGPYDLPAAALGVGPLGRGDGVLVLGTTLACQVLVDTVAAAVPGGGTAGATADTPAAPAGLTLRTGDDDGWLRAMPAMVGTACLDWVLGLVREPHTRLDALLAASPPGGNGVRALPYLSPAGERAPFADPAARGELSGLSVETTPADTVRAVCEALAYATRHCFEAAGLTGEVAVCGGGSASPELLRLLADVLGRPLSAVVEPEPTARGAVLAAERALGLDGGGRRAVRRTVVEPRAALRGHHEDGYGDYLDRVATASRHRWHPAATPTRTRGA